MKLTNLLKNLNYIEVHGNQDVDIYDITEDSRIIKKGFAFIAIKGFQTDGHKYIEQAIDKGAAVIFYDADISIDENCTYVKLKSTSADLSYLSSAIYENTSNHLKVVGITGTNGKTTSTYMISHILNEEYDTTCSIGTNGVNCPNQKINLKNTTPNAPELMRIFKQLDQEIHCKAVVMEVSSHAMTLHRVDDVFFDIKIFTNLTIEHLDLHGTMEDYYEAKKKLFLMNKKPSIINADDEYGKRLIQEIPTNVITYGSTDDCDYYFYDIIEHSYSSNFKLKIKDQSYKVDLPMAGKYNIYNATASIATCVELGLSEKQVIESIGHFKGAEGRLEMVSNKKNKNIIIDFAHSKDALEKLLLAIHPTGKKILVFGVSGERVHEIRYEMGKVAAKHSDIQIVTEDDSNYDTVENISKTIVEGIKSEKKDSYYVIPDRKEAIQFAIELAGPEDAVICAGKGHEVGMKINGVRIGDYNERQTIEEILGN